MFCGECLFCDKILVHLGHRPGSVYDTKDCSAVIVEDHDSKIRSVVVVPERIAIVEEGNVARYQSVNGVGAQSMADNGARASIDATGSAIGINLYAFLV